MALAEYDEAASPSWAPKPKNWPPLLILVLHTVVWIAKLTFATFLFAPNIGITKLTFALTLAKHRQ